MKKKLVDYFQNFIHGVEERQLAAYFRNFIYGVEDSLISTVGLLSGVVIADVSRKTVLLTGLVLIFVEAFSMSVGSYLSEHSAEHYLRKSGKEVADFSIKAGIIMFGSYFISGFIPLAPYTFLPISVAFWASIIVSLIALFVLGLISAKVSKEKPMVSGLRMFLVGGVAIGLGVIVGKIVSLLG